MTPRPSLLRSTFAYSLNALVGPLFTILLTPIYARVLPQADLGVVETVLALGMLLSVLGGFGMNTALGVYIHAQPDEPAQRRLIATAHWLAISGCGLLALLGVLAAGPLAALWVGDARYAPEVAIYVLNLPFGALVAVQVAALRLRQESWRASMVGVAHVLLLAFWNLLLVVGLRLGALGALGAQAAAIALLSLVALFAAPRYLFSRPLPALARVLLLAGLPLVPAGLSVWALGYADRFLLVQLQVPLETIAVYGIGNKLASMLAVASLPFMLAYTPYALAIARQPEAPRVYARAFRGYVAVMLAGALALGLFAREALLLIGTERFLDAQRYVWILAYGPLIQGCYNIVITGLLITRKTPHLAWTSALGAGLNLLLNLLLVPRLGALGAAIATPIGYACGPLAAYVVAQRAFPVPYELPRLLVALAAQGGLLALGLPLGYTSSPLTLGLRALLLLSYPLTLLALGVVSRAELALAWRWLQARLPRRNG